MLKLSVILIKMLFIDINMHYCIRVVARVSERGKRKSFRVEAVKTEEIHFSWMRVEVILWLPRDDKFQ